MSGHNRWKFKMKKCFAFFLSLMLAMALPVAKGEKSGAAEVFAKDSEGDIVVIIDPGHGGYDGGAVSVYGDKEADLNWNIAQYMKAELETYAGVKVYVTRANNEWNSNTGRSQFGITLGADVIISIHNNSSGNADTSGFVGYGSIVPDYSETTKNLCLTMAKYAVAAGLDLYNEGYLTRSGTNPSEDYYTVIDEGIKAGIPTIIAEHCFLSNASNAGFINAPENQRKVGVADATAVAEFFGLSKRTVSDGQSIALDRSYSAYFVPGVNRENMAVSFSSSDSNVARVREDGLITAVNAGTATVTYTYADGTTGSCSFTTKEVRQVGVAAGIIPTVYHSSEAVAAIDKSRIMVKAIYSDGTCRQQSSGYTIGDIDPNVQGRQFISVYHNGFNGSFSIVLDADKEAGSYSDYLYQVKGDYADGFTYPELVDIEGVSGSPYTGGGYAGNTDPEETSASAPVQTPEESTEQTAPPEETTETSGEGSLGGTQGGETESTSASSEEPVSDPSDTGTEGEKESGTDMNMPSGENNSGSIAGGNTEIQNTAAASRSERKDSGIDWFLMVLVLVILLLFVLIVLAVRSIVKNNRYNRSLEGQEEAEPKRKKRR